MSLGYLAIPNNKETWTKTTRVRAKLPMGHLEKTPNEHSWYTVT